MKKLKKIAITAPYLQIEWDEYQDRFDEFDVIVPKVEERFEEDEMIRILSKDIEGLICGDDRITKKVIDSTDKLKLIVKWGTGIDSIDKVYAESKGIKVLNTPNAFTIPVSESAIGLMLSLIRKIDENNRLMHNGNWHKPKGLTLNELTVGIIGYGNIGSEIAKKLSVFTENILWYDTKSDDELRSLNRSFYGKRTNLETLLENSDIITLHCDLNSTSHHLVNSTLLSKMKHGVIIINTARGPIIKEDDLIASLMDGKVSYVGMDVYENEPLPVDSVLRKMDNCILLSHNTNTSDRYWKRVHLNSISMLKDNI
jgi:D-3-phosphoglycerate dehydrogenase / 2-oxoglutarate reductase